MKATSISNLTYLVNEIFTISSLNQILWNPKEPIRVGENQFLAIHQKPSFVILAISKQKQFSEVDVNTTANVAVH